MRMNKLGIIGAMDEEIEILKDEMKIHNIEKIAGIDFFQGKIEQSSVILVKCGIGKVNAALCTQILITHFQSDYIINTGVAGAVSDILDIGDIVISKDLIQHDFDATSFGYKIGQIPRLEEYIFKADKKLIEIAKQISNKEVKKHNVYVGRIVSGDIFIADDEKRNDLWNKFEGYCAEMEGAAIAHVCYLNKIPFVVLRAISDKANSSAKVNFGEFVHEAAVNSADILKGIIRHNK